MKMMTKDEIQTELGWSSEMIRKLLPEPDSDSVRRNKETGEYTRGLYRRDRIMAPTQTPEVLTAKWHWDSNVFGHAPPPGWTTRLGDIGRKLGIAPIAVGRILDLLGLRSKRHVTKIAVVSDCGVRRWDGDRTHQDWHVERVVAAIGAAAASSGGSALAEAIEADLLRQQAAQRKAARRQGREEAEAAHQREVEGRMTGLREELVALLATDPGMTMLHAVEFVGSDPGDRLTLYRRCCGAEHDPTHLGERPDDSTAAKGLALLERRAKTEGFQL